MARTMEGRVRYDEEADSFIYEIRTVDELDNGDEEIGEWETSSIARCWRREGADVDEGTNFVHFSFMKQVLGDAWNHDMRVHLA